MRCLSRLWRRLASFCVLTALAAACGSSSPQDAVGALAVARQSYLEADDTFVVADGNAEHTILATARDAAGLPLTGQSVLLFSDDDSLVFVQPQPTDANGQTRGAVRSATGGRKWVQGLLAGQQGVLSFGHGVRVNFSEVEVVPHGPGPIPTPSANLYLYTDSINVAANGNDALTLYVSGRRLGGQTIFLTSSRPTDVLVPSSGVLSSSGLLRVTLRSTHAGARVLRASVGGLSKQLTTSLLPGAPDANHSFLVLSPNTAMADGASAITLSGVVADRFDNSIPNLPVFFVADNALVTFGSSSGMSDDLGVFAIDARSTVAGTPNFTVFLGTSPNIIALSACGHFVSGPASATHSSLVANPNGIDEGQSSVVSLALADAFGNPVGNEVVVFQAGSPNDVFSPQSVVTDANGNANTLFTPGLAGTRRVTAQTPTIPIPTDLMVRPADANAAHSSFVASPNQTIVDGATSVSLALVVRDANDIPMSQIAVAFTSLDANVALSPNPGVTDAQGMVSSTATSSVPSSTLIEANWSDATMGIDVFFLAE